MKISEMNFKEFLNENDLIRDKRNRTVNIKESIHNFYKQVAAHYDVGMSTIITNILLAWKEEHKDHIKADMVRKIRKIDF